MRKMKFVVKVLLVVSMFLGFSCSNEDEKILGVADEPPVNSTRSLDDSDELPHSDTVKLGAKLPNPYDINVMREAAMALVDSGFIDAVFANIQPTHYYIRFLPLDSADMDEIYFHPDLILFDYPLDYEVLTSGGSFYRAPDLPDGQPNSQYTVVPVDMILPNVNY